MIVHKFGGSSLASAEKIKNVSNIISCVDEAVVVSASAKTTSNLQKAIDQAIESQDYSETLNFIFEHHSSILEELVPSDDLLQQSILEDLKNIKHILSTIAITGFCADSLRFFILGFGEIWSAKILTLYLQSKGKKSYFIDASLCLIVNDRSYPVTVDWQKSLELLESIKNDNPADVYIITGFIAQNRLGKRTILGLNCSDYSAAIFAKLLQADKLYIWTDVAGVYSANPQVVPEAKPLTQLTYKEALELAYFGASVVHPLTIAPMALERTPIYIKSSYFPNEVGTKISADKDENQGIIKGLTSVSDVAIVRVQGAGMIGVSGISFKVFGALEKAEVSVMMISQASSEYSICFAIDSVNADKATEALRQEFANEIKSNLIEEIVVHKHHALITAVGEGMKSKTGSLAKLVNSLKLANINIHAIAQGSSERSVTFAVKAEDEIRGVQAMHRHYNSESDDIAIAVIGAGNIGKAFIKQVKKTYEKWYAKGINLVLVGATNSKQMRVSYENLLFENIDNLLNENTEQVNLERLAEFMSHASATKKIVIDATASENVSKNYSNFLKNGISVITPNKYANSGNYEFYQELRKVAKQNGTSFLYETNVCAGLPLIVTLQNMVQSGDHVSAIKGIFSGTLSYLFTQLNNGVIFSDAVKMAYDAGYTEPDPRQDLSGMDVARKTVILAREIGLNIGLNDLIIENLVPEELRECSVEEFFAKLPAFNEQIMHQIADKKKDLAGVHYVGSIVNGVANVGIQAYDESSPFASVKDTDNIVMINTDRYTQPMVIQGAGAGVEVTAAGVYADVITVIREK
ncbi:bifunctional aspartate kinase/homoserine dehydrogenase I [Francisella philomiragia]|uniref:Bifunctional aspartokinase/homoserine dehydrogenase n=1 Tax=Francisella philomiragia subsp. philomiragia (strain ATCC 25017 / CCUG 19701 / FSC 153 / O\|nr:bifunctional aspartate kinase/homoserine dehydrogenase I [Francisella philomiragia]AJI47827.1 aspartate kinase domain protein [Francisella philomiragia]AJI49317.1 aspartate kinase domain protein [Francisella philomiragia]MBK2020853.1 bifunctional aspartate kinase/homoserine dehydrogenase I [Francisella philomiragia]MBK2030195.1 bifunctional aspartate kinase/homoserine dehydrogenase I [Francisella philomiragia]MBK2264701.1 bifunctional aspartate kinase/homoserine dehydrogenase I [Francisella